jgi:pimeloyl-ACP methyl ester carboxylesterase
MKLAQKLAIRYVKARLRMLALVSKKKAAKKALKLFSTPMKRAKVKTPAIFEKGEKLSFRLEGHTARGHRWLPKKIPLKKVLIMHGFNSSSKKFSSYVSAFISKEYEVIAFDAPAHGDSGGKEINLPLYVKMIDEIYKKFGPIQSFMGHSFGGLAVACFLENIPNNIETKLVLIAPVTETKTAIDMFFEYLGLDQEVRKEFDEMILERTGNRAEYFSVRRAMQQIKASVLWLHDKEDDITPIKDALKVQEDNHANIKFIFTKGLGHRKIYKDQEVVKAVVDFL